MRNTTFALFFGNRGFMPAELILDARKEMVKAVTDAGFDYIIMDESATRYGAVETRDEGRLYHDWLEKNRNKFDGVILCMPIFVDENGAIAALRDANVPILMQAYPDEIGKMDFQHRRDAFCGKFSVTDVFSQYKVPFITTFLTFSFNFKSIESINSLSVVKTTLSWISTLSSIFILTISPL